VTYTINKVLVLQVETPCSDADMYITAQCHNTGDYEFSFHCCENL